MRTKSVVIVVACAATIVVIGWYKGRANAISQLQARVDQIYEIFEQYQIPHDIDGQSVSAEYKAEASVFTGITEFKGQITAYVEKNQPVEMLMVGFPFKSANTQQKVFGYMPDMAERRSLEYLQSMLDRMRAVYSPGAHVTIFTDGVAFAPFLGIPFEHVIAYEEGLIQLSSDLTGISWHTSASMMTNHNLKSLEEINTLFDTYPPTDQQFRQMHPSLSEVTKRRIGLELDHPAGRALLKKYPNKLEHIVFNIVSREARMRNYIIAQFLPSEYIRLTVHFSPDLSKKFGIKLSPTGSVTPYHGVCVQKPDGFWTIEFKKDVKKSGCRVETTAVNGIECPFYMCDE
jgi:L-tyrosine isonitrile synthase